MTGNCQGFSCSKCSSGQTSYLDRTNCVSCGNTTAGVGSDNDCVCSDIYNEALVENDVVGNKLSSKACVSCPSRSKVIITSGLIAGKRYSANKYLCQYCPDASVMTMSYSNGVYSCSCDSGYTLTGVSGIGSQSCISTSMASSFISVEPDAIKMTYTESAKTVISLTLKHYFVSAATYCTYYRGPQDNAHCQSLANLCVLQLYAQDSEACIAHQALLTSRSSNNTYNVVNWVSALPWIYFSSDFSGSQVCRQDIYESAVSLSSYNLRYVMASYYLNGTFKELQDVDSFFSFCTRSNPDSDKGAGNGSTFTKWQIYAYTYKHTYSCELHALLELEQLFYEVYLYDENNAANDHYQYVPVPVRISNNEMEAYSRSLCDSTDTLVRRFYLFDIVSGISSVGSKPEVIRYASFINLDTRRIQSTQRGVYPTVLTVTYSENLPSSWTQTNVFPSDSSSTEYIYTNDVVDMKFQASYTMDLHSFQQTLLGFFSANMVLTGIVFAIRYYNWNVRNSRVVTAATLTTDLGAFNMNNVFEVFLLIMNTFVLMFFFFTLLVTWYFFVFYKLQTVPSVMLPPQNNIYQFASPYFPFVSVIYVMAFFQVAYVSIKLVYRQSQSDLFFIDWEPGKLGNSSANNHSTNVGGKRGAVDNKNVSVWRTILVANEFAELQTQRRIDLHFTLFFLGFFLIGLNLQSNAVVQPILSDHSDGDSSQFNIVLRFANSTFFWLIVSLAQWLWKYLIYERYISEPPEQVFVDFCTLAKISIFILDEKYHGYYLHCRSPHQYADGNMVELIEMLGREESGLTSDRALEGGAADVQTYEMFLSAEIRSEYEKINAQLIKGHSNIIELLNQKRMQQQQMSSPTNNRNRFNTNNTNYNNNNNNNSIFGLNRRYNRLNPQKYRGIKLGNMLYNISPEKLVKTYVEMLGFLSDFIENNYEKNGLRRTIREKNYYEVMMHSAPDLTLPDQPSVFFADREFSYIKTMFLGNELDLLLMNILSYSLFDLWFNNTLVSILLAYLLNWLLTYLRHEMGEVSTIL